MPLDAVPPARLLNREAGFEVSSIHQLTAVAHKHLVLALLNDPRIPRLVPETRRILRLELHLDPLGLPGREPDLLEALQLLDRAANRRRLLRDVDLRDFRAGHRTGVRDIDGDDDLVTRVLDLQVCECERRV